jgi:general secretion pathway protein G
MENHFMGRTPDSIDDCSAWTHPSAEQKGTGQVMKSGRFKGGAFAAQMKMITQAAIPIAADNGGQRYLRLDKIYMEGWSPPSVALPSSGAAPERGYSMIEVMIAIAIVSILAVIATPNYIQYRENAKIAAVITEIRGLEKAITSYAVDNGVFPPSLDAIGFGDLKDMWGTPYQYLPVEGNPPGMLRKDRFMVPVNTDYDLYSMGKDKRSVSPFTAKHSRDDIVRANNGAFVGLASNF